MFGERGADGNNTAERLSGKSDGARCLHGNGIVGDTQVRVPFNHPALNFLSPCNIDAKAQMGVLAAERPEAILHQIGGKPFAHGDTHHLTARVPELAKLIEQERLLILPNQRMLTNQVPGIRQRNALGAALHQGNAKPRLRFDELATDRRRRHVQPFGSATDRTLAGNDQKRPQKAAVQCVHQPDRTCRTSRTQNSAPVGSTSSLKSKCGEWSPGLSPARAAPSQI